MCNLRLFHTTTNADKLLNLTPISLKPLNKISNDSRDTLKYNDNVMIIKYSYQLSAASFLCYKHPYPQYPEREVHGMLQKCQSWYPRWKMKPRQLVLLPVTASSEGRVSASQYN